MIQPFKFERLQLFNLADLSLSAHWLCNFSFNKHNCMITVWKHWQISSSNGRDMVGKALTTQLEI